MRRRDDIEEGRVGEQDNEESETSRTRRDNVNLFKCPFLFRVSSPIHNVTLNKPLSLRLNYDCFLISLNSTNPHN